MASTRRGGADRADDHLPPLVRRHTGVLDKLETGDLALGVLDDAEFTQDTVTIEPGDLVVLMSDGVVESTSVDQEQIGFGRIEDMLRRSRGGAEATLDQLLTTVREFVSDAPQYDDLTTVCFSRETEESGHTTSMREASMSQATVFGWGRRS